MKTRHQKWSSETGGRHDASMAEFRTRRPRHICETSRCRAVFERSSYVTRWKRTGWLWMQSRSNRSPPRQFPSGGKNRENSPIYPLICFARRRSIHKVKGFDANSRHHRDGILLVEDRSDGGFLLRGRCRRAVQTEWKSSITAYIDDFVSDPDGLRLAKAFMRIPKSAARQRIIALVREIAGEERDAPQAPPALSLRSLSFGGRHHQYCRF